MRVFVKRGFVLLSLEKCGNFGGYVIVILYRLKFPIQKGRRPEILMCIGGLYLTSWASKPSETWSPPLHLGCKNTSSPRYLQIYSRTSSDLNLASQYFSQLGRPLWTMPKVKFSIQKEVPMQMLLLSFFNIILRCHE